MKNIQQILDKKGHDVWSIHPDDSVLEAIQMMADKNVGALVVTQDDRLVGLITEREYTRNVFLKGKSSPKTKVGDIMLTHVVCARLDQTVEESMAVMTERHARHLPVLHEKKLVGIVSIGDVVKAIIEDKEHDIEELEHYIQNA